MVGKGIIYDTGGLSLKSKVGMPGMKGDMAGAAAVLCAFEACVHLQIPVEISAILCLAVILLVLKHYAMMISSQ